jgi:LysM repeat protein
MGRTIGRVLAPIGALGLVVLVVTFLGSSELLAGEERPEEVSTVASTQTTIIDLSQPAPTTTTLPAEGAGADGSTTTSITSAEQQATSSTMPAATAANGATTYTVKPGDSPYSIARQFDISTARLMEANGIDDPRVLRPGTVLSIPTE